MRPDLVKSCLLILLCAGLGSTFGFAAEFGLVGALFSIYWILRRATKLHTWINSSKQLPHTEEGVFYHLHRDIREKFDEHREDKLSLQKTLIKFREASAALPDAVVIFDDSGVISWANKLAKQLLGIDGSRDIGQRVTNILRSPKFVEALEKHNEEPLNIDLTAPLQQSGMINIKVVDLSENTRMLVARDITRLTDINKAQRDFVSNVSHELKTPLTVMRGYLEMLEGADKLPANLSKPITDMHAQTQRMQYIIEELLYLAKLEGQVDFNPSESHETLSIESIVDMIMDSAEPLAKQNNQTINIDIEKNLPIQGNTSELQIAFNNLVVNAIRYTPENGEISIKWFKRDHTVVFSVTDNGIGIAPNHIDRITERFYRVDQGRSREKGGTGLGLAIVKNILERHNCQLIVKSSLGSGSCFECVFPID